MDKLGYFLPQFNPWGLIFGPYRLKYTYFVNCLFDASAVFSPTFILHLKRIISNIIAFSLLLCLFTGSFIYYAYIDLNEIILKSTASLGMREKGSESVFCMNAVDFDKADKDEIRQDNELYDIQSYTRVNGKVYIHATRDKQEESLLAQISRHFSTIDASNSSGSDTRIGHKIPPHFNDVKCLTQKYSFQPLFNSTAPLNASPQCAFSPLTYIEFITPPPKA